MRLPTIPAAVPFAVLAALGLSPDPARAAPASLPARPLDIELKAADVRNVFSVLAEAAGKKVVLDACVRGTIDLRLKNTPVPLVFDALASKLRLVYVEEDGTIRVDCAGDAGSVDPRTSARVSVAVKDLPLGTLLEQIAKTARLEGVDYRAGASPQVTVTLEGVKLETALLAIADSTGVRVAVRGGRIVASN